MVSKQPSSTGTTQGMQIDSVQNRYVYYIPSTSIATDGFSVAL